MVVVRAEILHFVQNDGTNKEIFVLEDATQKGEREQRRAFGIGERSILDEKRQRPGMKKCLERQPGRFG